MLRSALVMFGLLFLPMAILFAYKSWPRYWIRSAVLLAVSIVFLWLGLSRSERSWVTIIDDLDAGGGN
jgi:MFS superfamily sulfate permease-like transporter